MQALEECEPHLLVEALPHRLQSGDYIVPHGVEMSRVEAERHPLPKGGREGIA